MQSLETREEFQNEIQEKCRCCGKSRVVAYWDYELESYIYLSESDICLKCGQEHLYKEKEFV